ncbi:MAG: hypothetical protein NZO58_12725 [Gemmataceae bacterium]|nr:hypothetical protein [Gemmataceae bacterium]
MTMHRRVGMALLLLSVTVLLGCGGHHGGSHKSNVPAAKKHDDDHDHGPGPHNGVVFDFGKWHCEFTVDHKAGEATIYVLTATGNKPVAIHIEKPLLSIKKPQFQVELKAVPQSGDPEGKSSRYVAKHEHFAKEQEFEGTLSGVVDGKPYVADFKEEEHNLEKK